MSLEQLVKGKPPAVQLAMLADALAGYERRTLAKTAPADDPAQVAYDACRKAGYRKNLTDFLSDAEDAAAARAMSTVDFCKLLAGSPSDLRGFVGTAPPTPRVQPGAATPPTPPATLARTRVSPGVRAELRKLGRTDAEIDRPGFGGDLGPTWEAQLAAAARQRAATLGVPVRGAVPQPAVRDVTDGPRRLASMAPTGYTPPPTPSRTVPAAPSAPRPADETPPQPGLLQDVLEQCRRFGWTGSHEQFVALCQRYGATQGWDTNRVLRFLRDSGALGYGLLMRFGGSQGGSTGLDSSMDFESHALRRQAERRARVLAPR